MLFLKYVKNTASCSHNQRNKKIFNTQTHYCKMSGNKYLDTYLCMYLPI